MINMPKVFRNFYFITGLIFLVWMLFVDANDWLTQARNTLHLNELQSEKAFYRQKIDQVQRARLEVLGSPALREKYAREHYLMKRRNEDIYVVVDEQDKALEQ
jgi:cell division protein DivIC